MFEVLLIPDLPKSASLPVATVQAAQSKFLKNEWDFEYMYFTESDQVCMCLHLLLCCNLILL